MSETKIRVLVAKPGLDGHDVGAKLVCRALMAAGMEVIYTGLRQSPEAIARTALAESVDVVGLSILSGAHLPLSEKVIAKLRDSGLSEVPVVVGGNIPARDVAALEALGVAAVFPTGTPFDTIVSDVRKRVGA
jgi:methylmalonyl-CoA mutase C-terminal domain/subunit